VAQAQQGRSAFALIVADEAHRTTGATLAGESESAVARVGLQQPARPFVLVRRGGRVVRKLRSTCISRGRRATVRWDGRLRRRGKLRPARPGRYRVQLIVRSDRRPVKRSGWCGCCAAVAEPPG